MKNDPDVIKHEIDQLQARMKARADEVSEKLSAGRLVQELFDGVARDPAQSIDQLVGAVRRHPIASTMAAAGAATLIGSVSAARARNGASHRINGPGGESQLTETSGGVGSKVSEAGEAIKDAASTVKAKAADVANRVTETTKAGQQKLSSAASRAADTGRELTHRTSDAAEEVRQFAKNNPVALGLFALSVGALAASVMTVRRDYEDEHEADLEPMVPPAPKTRQAKKATRAKTTPNKVVRKMNSPARTAGSSRAAAGTTAGSATGTSAGSSGSSAKPKRATTRSTGARSAAPGRSDGTKTEGSIARPATARTRAATSPATLGRAATTTPVTGVSADRNDPRSAKTAAENKGRGFATPDPAGGENRGSDPKRS